MSGFSSSSRSHDPGFRSRPSGSGFASQRTGFSETRGVSGSGTGFVGGSPEKDVPRYISPGRVSSISETPSERNMARLISMVADLTVENQRQNSQMLQRLEAARATGYGMVTGVPSLLKAGANIMGKAARRATGVVSSAAVYVIPMALLLTLLGFGIDCTRVRMSDSYDLETESVVFEENRDAVSGQKHDIKYVQGTLHMPTTFCSMLGIRPWYDTPKITGLFYKDGEHWWLMSASGGLVNLSDDLNGSALYALENQAQKAASKVRAAQLLQELSDQKKLAVEQKEETNGCETDDSENPGLGEIQPGRTHHPRGWSVHWRHPGVRWGNGQNCSVSCNVEPRLSGHSRIEGPR